MIPYPRPPEYAHLSADEWAKECDDCRAILLDVGPPRPVEWALSVLAEQQKLIAAFEADAPDPVAMMGDEIAGGEG